MINKIIELSEQNLYACYQCGKCSAGCPSVSLMDLMPNQVIRYLQIGKPDKVLQCKTIWICASCYTCSVRCPRGIDLTRVMEAIRLIQLRKNIDYIKVREISEDVLVSLPQIALVAEFRKHTA